MWLCIWTWSSLKTVWTFSKEHSFENTGCLQHIVVKSCMMQVTTGDLWQHGRAGLDCGWFLPTSVGRRQRQVMAIFFSQLPSYFWEPELTILARLVIQQVPGVHLSVAQCQSGMCSHTQLLLWYQKSKLTPLCFHNKRWVISVGVLWAESLRPTRGEQRQVASRGCPLTSQPQYKMFIGVTVKKILILTSTSYVISPYSKVIYKSLS